MSVSTRRGRIIRIVVYGACLLALAGVVAFQGEGLEASLRQLRHARPLPLVGAIGALLGAYAYAALCYRALALYPIAYGRTLIVQLATGFTNRVLPAGLGGLGLYGIYLHRQGHTGPAAAAVVASNNVLGFVGNIVLAAAILLIHPKYINTVHIPAISPAIIAGVAIALLLIGFILFVRSTHSLAVVWGTIRTTLRALMRVLRPGFRPAAALMSNMALTSLMALCLSLSALSVGWDVPWAAALIVVSFGTLSGALVPLPGGIGSADAGLFAGLLAYDVPAPVAAAAVLLYRGITYWLPIVPGLIAFRYVDKQYLRRPTANTPPSTAVV